VALDILKERGVPLARQNLSWQDMVRTPISKLDDDAFTRVRIILMNGIEMEAMRFSHSFARMCPDLGMRRDLAEVRRAEQHQQVLVNWLLPADQSPLETTIAYEQVAIEVTAHLALAEPDPYIAQVLRFGLLEDFDHLYRYSALLDRLEGKDANSILQSRTDISPGRPTIRHHRAPIDDVREHYDRTKAHPITKLHAITILAGEQQTQNYYLNFGPTFADPVARQLYAEIGHVEEEHVTQYESIIDPNETWIEKWLLHEATEVYNYWSCVETESNPRIKGIWTRMLDYELGHLHHVMEVMKRVERRDPAELLPAELPDPIGYHEHRDFVRKVLAAEVGMMSIGTQFVNPSPGSPATIAYRARVNEKGSPSETVAQGYCWSPGTELTARPAPVPVPRAKGGKGS
jgi:hypothetical protein